eukprot:6200291-Pleurochrysis_carterae.AAC.1
MLDAAPWLHLRALGCGSKLGSRACLQCAGTREGQHKMVKDEKGTPVLYQASSSRRSAPACSLVASIQSSQLSACSPGQRGCLYRRVPVCPPHSAERRMRVDLELQPDVVEEAVMKCCD